MIVRMNACQIQQALTNLVTNAWEVAGENQGIIGLTVKMVSKAKIPAKKRFPAGWQPKEGVYACLEVANTGCGIPESDIENIFDPFFTTKSTARGLGLSVVLGIAGAHGGGGHSGERAGPRQCLSVLFAGIGGSYPPSAGENSLRFGV